MTNGIAESFGPVAASVWLIVGGYAAKLTYEKAAGTGKSGSSNSNSNKGELNGGSRSSDSRSTGGSGSGGASSRGNGPLPVTVVTGFLGSGKTTFVKRLLAEEHGKKYALLPPKKKTKKTETLLEKTLMPTYSDLLEWVRGTLFVPPRLRKRAFIFMLTCTIRVTSCVEGTW